MSGRSAAEPPFPRGRSPASEIPARNSTRLFTNPLTASPLAFTASPLAFTASLPKQKHSRAKSRQLRRLLRLQLVQLLHLPHLLQVLQLLHSLQLLHALHLLQLLHLLQNKIRIRLHGTRTARALRTFHEVIHEYCMGAQDISWGHTQAPNPVCDSLLLLF